MFPFNQFMNQSKLPSQHINTLGLTTLTLLCVSVHAQVMPNTTLPTTTLDTIFVTATNTPTKTSNLVAQTTVIDAEALKKYQGRSVLDVLKHQSGFGFYESGGMGKKSSFYLRGLDSSQVLVLINGVRFNSLDAGQPPINLLSADQIERIEILHGSSGSSIYGADAMGGVIQIFTKGSAEHGSGLSATVGYGSHNQLSYGATAQLSNQYGAQFSVSANHNETDGFNAIHPISASNYYPDKDGFESNNFSLAASQKVNDEFRVGLNALYSESMVEYDSGDSYLDTYADNINGSASAFIEYDNKGNTAKLSYGQSISELDAYDKSSPNGKKYDSEQEQLRFESNFSHNYRNAKGVLKVGTEYVNQSLMTNSDNYPAKDRSVKSGFLGYSYLSDGIDVQANARLDDYSDYDSQATYNLGFATHFGDNLRVGASYNTAFRQPSFNDLFYPGSNNPELKPEEIENYELFAEVIGKNNKTRLTRYHSDITNLIDYDSSNGWKKGNIQQAEIEGTTFNTDWTLNDYIFGASYDYQEAINKSGVYKDEQIKFRPRHKGKLYAGYEQDTFDIRAEAEYVGSRYANDAYGNGFGTRMDNYTLVNLVGNYQLTDSLSSTLRLNNIANKEYSTIDTYGTRYNTDGTNVFASLTYEY